MNTPKNESRKRGNSELSFRESIKFPKSKKQKLHPNLSLEEQIYPFIDKIFRPTYQGGMGWNINNNLGFDVCIQQYISSMENNEIYVFSDDDLDYIFRNFENGGCLKDDIDFNLDLLHGDIDLINHYKNEIKYFQPTKY